MDIRSMLASTPVCIGAGLAVVGISASALGIHNGLTSTFAPLGLGIILRFIVKKIADSKRARVKVPVRRNQR